MRKRAKKIIRLFDDAVTAEQRYQFQEAKRYYTEIAALHPGSPEAEIAKERIADMDTLAREKTTYQRIHHNARRILCGVASDGGVQPVFAEHLAVCAAGFEDSVGAHNDDLPLGKRFGLPAGVLTLLVDSHGGSGTFELRELVCLRVVQQGRLVAGSNPTCSRRAG